MRKQKWANCNHCGRRITRYSDTVIERVYELRTSGRNFSDPQIAAIIARDFKVDISPSTIRRLAARVAATLQPAHT